MTRKRLELALARIAAAADLGENDDFAVVVRRRGEPLSKCEVFYAVTCSPRLGHITAATCALGLLAAGRKQLMHGKRLTVRLDNK